VEPLKKISDRSSSVQSVHRALSLLSLVARIGPPGARLLQLVELSGLTRPTAHRLLSQLIESGLLMQSGRFYQLGAGAFELGVAAAHSFPLRDIASPLLDEIANETGDSVFLVVRSGADGLCIDRKLGSYPVKVQTFEVGHRQPLGVGANGLAMLSFLPPDEQEQCLEQIAVCLKQRIYRSLSVARLREMMAETRSRGWAVVSHYAIDGVTGVGVPVFDSHKRAFASITTGAISLRMTEQKIQETVALLRPKARVLESRLARNHEAAT